MGFYEKIRGKKKATPGNKVKKSDMAAGPKEPTSEKAGTATPSDASTLSNKGNTLVESGLYAEAIQCYDKALEINPKMEEIWNNKGLALARTGRHSEAVQCYDRALEIAPGDAEVIYNKGIALSHLGNHNEAIQCYDKLIEIDPSDSGAWCSKGDVLFESGNFEEALKAYDKSIGINPKDETSWNNRGLTLVKLNRFAEAVESYDKALEINPKIEKIWSNKGLALARMKENGDKVDLQKIATSMPAEEIGTPTDGSQSPASDPGRHELKAESSAGPMETVQESTGMANDMDKPVSGQVIEVPGPTVEEKHPFTEDKPAESLESRAEVTAKVETKKESIDEIIKIPIQEGKLVDKPKNVETVVHTPAIEEKVPHAIDVPTLKTENAVEATIPGGEPAIKPENTEKAVPSPAIEEKASSIIDTAPQRPDTVVETAILGSEQVVKPEKVETAVLLPAIKEEVPSVSVIDTPPKNEIVETQIPNRELVDKSADMDVAFQLPALEKEPLPDKASLPETDIQNKVTKEAYVIEESKESNLGAIKKQKGGRMPRKTPQAARKKPPVHNITHEHKKAVETITDRAGSTSTGEVEQSMESVALGNELFSMEKYEEAIKFFDKSLQIDPENNTAWNNKGIALARSGKFAEAIHCYDKALEIDSDDYVVLNNKGSVLYKKGNIKEAMECYKSALDLNAKSRTALHGMEICLKYLKKSVEN